MDPGAKISILINSGSSCIENQILPFLNKMRQGMCICSIAAIMEIDIFFLNILDDGINARLFPISKWWIWIENFWPANMSPAGKNQIFLITEGSFPLSSRIYEYTLRLWTAWFKVIQKHVMAAVPCPAVWWLTDLFLKKNALCLLIHSRWDLILCASSALAIYCCIVVDEILFGALGVWYSSLLHCSNHYLQFH